MRPFISKTTLKRFNLFFILTLSVIFEHAHLVYAQVPDITDCNDPAVGAGFCTLACGANPVAVCAPPPDQVCNCNPICHTGATPMPPLPLSANCPDPTVDPLVHQVCNDICSASCINPGGNGQFCAHLPTGGKTVSICTCACPSSETCPPRKPNSTDIASLLAWGAGLTSLTTVIKGFLTSMKGIYLTVFLIGKIIIALILLAGYFILLTSGLLLADGDSESG